MMNEEFEFSGDMNQLKASAEAGDAEAQFKLGHCYETDQSPWRDWMQIFRWYRKAAMQGHAQAQFKLGYCYEKGIGVPQDWTQAADWYGKAAEQGHTDAQNKLSECYYNGTGVPQDEKQAVYWYHRAAKLGDAEDKLRECYGESMPKKKNRRRKDEPIGPVSLIIAIAGSAFGAAIPFIDPEAVDMTPVCQFIIVYLYVYAVVIVVVLDRILDTISKRALSIILLLYFLSWAASIAFGFLVLGGSYGIMMILSPIMFWGLMLSVGYFKDQWQADKP